MIVGVVGGGQLGLMLAQAGDPLGLRFRFLDPSPAAPAGRVGELVVAPYDDPEALRQLGDGATAVTFEFENLPASAAPVSLLPRARALAVAQDRLHEKELFHRVGIATAPYARVDAPEDAARALATVGPRALLKTRRLGYDGKGQVLVGAEDEAVAAARALDAPLIAEGVVEFDRELSVLAVRSLTGETRFWPLTENVHRSGILRVSRAPAAPELQRTAEELAAAVLDELEYVGVLAIELFDAGGRLLANELAPRVHNSGHWTIEGAETSQFENHLRAILGLPLGDTAARAPSAMVNLIGHVPPLDRLLAAGARVHLYGKAPRAGRKLGHATVAGAEVEERVEALAALADAAEAEADERRTGKPNDPPPPAAVASVAPPAASAAPGQ